MIELSEYIITDGSRFIYKNHSGKYVPTGSITMADIYTKKQVESIFNHQLSKPLRKVFRIEKYDKPPENVKQVSIQDLEKNVEKVAVDDNIQIWIDRIADINGLTQEASKRKEILLQQLSDVDKEICDVMHYIEFAKLNAAQGYKAFKMIKDRRIKRRSIKNELNIISVILSKKFSDSISKEIIKTVENMDKRTYEPRMLKELFDL